MIHKTAIIDPKAKISLNVEIGPYSIIGPNVSIGSGTKILNSKIEGSIIQENTNIDNAKLAKSMIGNNVYYNGKNTPQEVSIGDFCEIK